jgi:hypothetical protein
MKKQADFLLPLNKAGRFQKVGRFSMVIRVLHLADEILMAGQAMRST